MFYPERRDVVLTLLQLETGLGWCWLCPQGIVALEFLSARLGEQGLRLGPGEDVSSLSLSEKRKSNELSGVLVS
jgi:hypothetical protein